MSSTNKKKYLWKGQLLFKMLFWGFFNHLRTLKIPTSTKEFIELMRALDLGLISNIEDFYSIGRAILIKDEKYYDLYDKAFLEFFGSQITEESIKERLSTQMANFDFNEMGLSFQKQDVLVQEKIENREKFQQLFNEMIRNIITGIDISQSKDQNNKLRMAIAPNNQNGLGIGGIQGGLINTAGGSSNTAMKVAAKRSFSQYSKDAVLNTRQIQVILRKLKELTREGNQEEELDIEQSVRETVRNLGEIEIKMRPKRKNKLKLLLLMDVGGTMVPYRELMTTIFSAAVKLTFFKQFRHYYFHNCIYDYLYEDPLELRYILTRDLLKELEKDKDYRIIFIGDAFMGADELLSPGGIIDDSYYNQTTGIEFLEMFKENCKKSVWLNPDISIGERSPTQKLIAEIFPMFDLTLEGIEEAIQILK